MEGYTVDPALLQEATNGIKGTIDELKTLGITEEAETGRGFGGLALRGLQVGHPGLQQALSGFCDRWSWGVRTLVQDSNEIARRMGLTAGAYYDQEQYTIGMLKEAFNAVGGDPNASATQVEGESFGQIAASNSPDYSAGSFDKADQHMAATWKAEGRGVVEGPLGLNKDLVEVTGNGQAFTRLEDQLFGPAPAPNSGGGGSASGAAGGQAQ